MITNAAVRSIVPKIARRGYAAAVTHAPSPSGKEVHPLFNDHPVAPVVTFDHVPVPCVPYKEGYQKTQNTMNALLGASVAAFLAVSFYVWKYDMMSLRLAGPPKWYSQRKIGKGLGDI